MRYFGVGAIGERHRQQQKRPDHQRRHIDRFGPANAVVHVTVDGSPISDTATGDASGMWNFTTAGLGQGPHTIVASETDTAGTTKTASLTFTLDTIAPTPLITSELLSKKGAVTLTGTTGEANDTIPGYDGTTWLGPTPKTRGGT